MYRLAVVREKPPPGPRRSDRTLSEPDRVSSAAIIIWRGTDAALPLFILISVVS